MDREGENLFLKGHFDQGLRTLGLGPRACQRCTKKLQGGSLIMSNACWIQLSHRGTPNRAEPERVASGPVNGGSGPRRGPSSRSDPLGCTDSVRDSAGLGKGGERVIGRFPRCERVNPTGTTCAELIHGSVDGAKSQKPPVLVNGMTMTCEDQTGSDEPHVTIVSSRFIPSVSIEYN